MALHLLHESPAAAIAFRDPRLGAVVVAAHSREWAAGQVVDLTLEQAEKGVSRNDLDWDILSLRFEHFSSSSDILGCRSESEG